MTQPELVSVTVSRRFHLAPEQVYDAFVTPELARRFMFTTADSEIIHVEIDPRAGGNYNFTDRRADADIEHIGAITELDRPRRFAFWFSVPQFAPDKDPVTIDIQTTGDSSCVVTLKHDMNPQWKDFGGSTEEAWRRFLADMARVLGDGPQGEAGYE